MNTDNNRICSENSSSYSDNNKDPSNNSIITNSNMNDNKIPFGKTKSYVALQICMHLIIKLYKLLKILQSYLY